MACASLKLGIVCGGILAFDRVAAEGAVGELGGSSEV
jgi:hypothetical protein